MGRTTDKDWSFKYAETDSHGLRMLFSLPAGMKHDLEMAAAANGCNASEYIRRGITRLLAEEDPQLELKGVRPPHKAGP
jgi:hypothetical protein